MGFDTRVNTEGLKALLNVDTSNYGTAIAGRLSGWLDDIEKDEDREYKTWLQDQTKAEAVKKAQQEDAIKAYSKVIQQGPMVTHTEGLPELTAGTYMTDAQKDAWLKATPEERKNIEAGIAPAKEAEMDAQAKIGEAMVGPDSKWKESPSELMARAMQEAGDLPIEYTEKLLTQQALDKQARLNAETTAEDAYQKAMKNLQDVNLKRAKAMAEGTTKGGLNKGESTALRKNLDDVSKVVGEFLEGKELKGEEKLKAAQYATDLATTQGYGANQVKQILEYGDKQEGGILGFLQDTVMDKGRIGQMVGVTTPAYGDLVTGGRMTATPDLSAYDLLVQQAKTQLAEADKKRQVAKMTPAEQRRAAAEKILGKMAQPKVSTATSKTGSIIGDEKEKKTQTGGTTVENFTGNGTANDVLGLQAAEDRKLEELLLSGKEARNTDTFTTENGTYESTVEGNIRNMLGLKPKAEQERIDNTITRLERNLSNAERTGKKVGGKTAKEIRNEIALLKGREMYKPNETIASAIDAGVKAFYSLLPANSGMVQDVGQLEPKAYAAIKGMWDTLPADTKAQFGSYRNYQQAVIEAQKQQPQGKYSGNLLDYLRNN